MIKIERPNFDLIATEHYNLLKDKIIDRTYSKSTCQISYFLTKNLEKIICEAPKVILEISEKFNDIFKAFKDETFSQPYIDSKKNLQSRKVNCLKYIFYYDEFAKKDHRYSGYDLAKKLNINVCPYCNRNFTSTVEKGKKKTIRPDFDHFFSKEKHPILALSFYNLIPSCQICNSRLKGTKQFDLINYFHPYINGFEDEITFNYLPNSTQGAYGCQNEFSIVFEEKSGKYKDKLKGSNDIFKYDLINEKHGDILEEVVAKIYKGSQTYLESIQSSFPELNMSKAEIYRLAYGNYMDEGDFEKRPFAKITKDIFDKLGNDLNL